MRVIFHGIFLDICDREYTVEADSVCEAIYAVVSQVPALQSSNGITCTVLGFSTVDSLYRTTDVSEVHVFPDYTVGGGIIQIAIGAVLIAASFIPGLNFLFSVGVSLVLGGLMQLLSPAPKRNTSSPLEASRYLGAPKNTTQIGTRIPIGYGLHKVSGHYLSYDVNVIG